MTNNITKIRAALDAAIKYPNSTHAERLAEEALAALAELEKAATEPAGKVGDGFVTWSANKCPPIGSDLYTTPPPAPATPDQTLSALTAYKAQQGDEYVRMQAALQAAGESK